MKTPIGVLAIILYLAPIVHGDHMSLPLGFAMLWGAMMGDILSIMYMLGLFSLLFAIAGIGPVRILLPASLLIFAVSSGYAFIECPDVLFVIMAVPELLLMGYMVVNMRAIFQLKK